MVKPVGRRPKYQLQKCQSDFRFERCRDRPVRDLTEFKGGSLFIRLFQNETNIRRSGMDLSTPGRRVNAGGQETMRLATSWQRVGPASSDFCLKLGGDVV